jgi:hypothetical protein
MKSVVKILVLMFIRRQGRQNLSRKRSGRIPL